MAIFVVFLNRKVTPIATSHHPMIYNHCSGSYTGNHFTVIRRTASAGDNLRGLKGKK
jgi:hypothetical protein